MKYVVTIVTYRFHGHNKILQILNFNIIWCFEGSQCNVKLKKTFSTSSFLVFSKGVQMLFASKQLKISSTTYKSKHKEE